MWRIEAGSDGHVLRELTGKCRVIKCGGWLRPRVRKRVAAWLIGRKDQAVEAWIKDLVREFGPLQRPLFRDAQTSFVEE